MMIEAALGGLVCHTVERALSMGADDSSMGLAEREDIIIIKPAAILISGATMM